MPAPLLHVGATVMCAHGGRAEATVESSRVSVLGRPTVTMSAPYVVVGCSLPATDEGGGPCITATWLTAATRVTSLGVPLLLTDSVAVCSPTGTVLTTTVAQTRVTAV